MGNIAIVTIIAVLIIENYIGTFFIYFYGELKIGFPKKTRLPNMYNSCISINAPLI